MRISRLECDVMTSSRKITALVTCFTVLCGAAILRPVYKATAEERKLAEVAKEIRTRAEQGDANAQYRLGYSYRWGAGVAQDYAEAFRWFRKAAEQGNAYAQFYVGFLYHQGWGVVRDDAESARWYRKAADQGYAYAQANLGLMYSDGQGVPRDEAEAARWYRKAAEQGDAYAQNLLGLVYVGGQGVPRDYAEAVRWFRKASDQGDAKARFGIGIMYQKGWGVPRSNTEAGRWFALGTWSSLGRGVPLERWTLIAAILLGMVLVFVRNRFWARAKWLCLATMSAFFAAILSHHLLHSGFSFALLVRGQLGTIFTGPGTVLLDALVAAMSAICGVGAVLEAVRGSKRDAEQVALPTE
jgi:TPR repeat protein